MLKTTNLAHLRLSSRSAPLSGPAGVLFRILRGSSGFSAFPGISGYFPSLSHNLSHSITRFNHTAPPNTPKPQTHLFSYSVGAAYRGKEASQPANSREIPKPLLGAHLLPKDRPATGEDAFFIKGCNDGRGHNGAALGVADGVGGWAASGITSSLFSYILCKKLERIMQDEAKFGGSEAVAMPNPVEALGKAHRAIQTEAEVPAGSSTACIGSVGSSGRLVVANLGDSWFGVLRDGQFVCESTPQTHGFNTPYQLMTVSPQTQRELHIHTKGYIEDKAEQSDVYRVQLQPGDVIVFATDGLVDNLFPKDVKRIIQEELGGKYKVGSEGGKGEAEAAAKRVATALVKEAYRLGLDRKYESPFYKELVSFYTSHYPGEKFPFAQYKGGKHDDVTVLVVLVQ